VRDVLNKRFIHIFFIIIILVVLTPGCFENNKVDKGHYKVTFYLLFDEDFKFNGTYNEISLYIDDNFVYNCTKSYYPFDPVRPHGKYETKQNYGNHKILVAYHNATINGEKTIFVDKELYVQSRLINNLSVEITLLNGPMKLK